MAQQQQQLRTFLNLLSDSSGPSEDSSSAQEMEKFIRCHGAKAGLRLKIPSLCSSDGLPSHQTLESEASFPTAVLRSALRSGHPLRTKQQYIRTDKTAINVSRSASKKNSKAQQIEENIARPLKYYSKPGVAETMEKDVCCGKIGPIIGGFLHSLSFSLCY
jgi:hypothetical protein